MSFDPRNILVIDFGQLGDVVLSLPALAAVRQRFPRARVTVAVGGAAASVVEMSGVADEALAVDRVGCGTGRSPSSSGRFGSPLLMVPRPRSAFVMDCHGSSRRTLS